MLYLDSGSDVGENAGSPRASASSSQSSVGGRRSRIDKLFRRAQSSVEPGLHFQGNRSSSPPVDVQQHAGDEIRSVGQ